MAGSETGFEHEINAASMLNLAGEVISQHLDYKV